ncbi:putative efflux protein, MATE family [Cetobacterium ceti]|uniref:Putative efflux protein, MATE family n=1 Tax=Cetobacterium ceti TaxID=180163 RepID=A0A1T4MWF3_9FUSO|nr:MATE family efflux transporter [Cetobacterium ceti]SJZ70978.1 putative efflux protein, MATE family [Cetobacterium ceti]
MKVTNQSLFSLTIPIFLELMLTTIIGNVDTIMLGRYSDQAVGAVGGISQVLLIQTVILNFICLGSSILIAQYIGAQNKDGIQKAISVSLIMNLIMGLAIGFFYFWGWEWILVKIKLPSSLIEIGKFYFRIVGGLCFFQGITLTCSAIMKSFGNTKEMLFVNVGINLLNILGNGMFIFGWFGAPILGVNGVGISTVVSRFIGAIVAITIMMKYCNFKFIYLKNFSFKIMKHILYIGIPSAGEYLSWSVAQLIILSMVNTMGTIEIAARTYLALISSFIMTFSIALGNGTAIQVGQLVGANKKDEAYSQCLKSTKLSFLAAGIVSVIIILLKKPIMNFFTTDIAVLNAAYKVFIWMILIETGRTLNIVIINSLNASGDVRFPVTMGVISMYGVAVPLCWFLGLKLNLGLIGIWLGNAADEWVRGIIMLRRWKSKKWTKKSFI